MRASTPRIETRSEGTLDCHTDAIMLREGVGAMGSTYLRGSPAGARPPGSGSSVPVSRGTQTTVSEPPPFAPVRSAFPDGKGEFVVSVGPARARVPARTWARIEGRRSAGTLPGRASVARAIRGAGVFALGAATAASVGELAERALETAALACIVAGAGLLLLALVRTGTGTREEGSLMRRSP